MTKAAVEKKMSKFWSQLTNYNKFSYSCILILDSQLKNQLC